MTIQSRSAGIWEYVREVYVRQAGVWVRAYEVYARSAGVWELAHQDLVITFGDVPNAFGSGFQNCGNPGITDTPDTSVIGGSGSYSYFWSRAGSASPNGALICSNPIIANPTWGSDTGTVCDSGPLGGGQIESWNLKVTDTVTGQIANKTTAVTRIWSDLS
jgi:hypothetical protein